MSINWQQSRVHALNTSSTKANYAFPKSPRFAAMNKPLYLCADSAVRASITSPETSLAGKEPASAEATRPPSGTGTASPRPCTTTLNRHSSWAPSGECS